MNGLEHIRAMLGDEQQSNLTNTDIKDALYNFYYDVEQATAHLLGTYVHRLCRVQS